MGVFPRPVMVGGMSWIRDILPGRLLFSLLACCLLLPLAVFSPRAKKRAKKKADSAGLVHPAGKDKEKEAEKDKKRGKPRERNAQPEAR